MCGKKNAKDGGVTMMEALNYAKLDYVSLGNHELLATAFASPCSTTGVRFGTYLNVAKPNAINLPFWNDFCDILE